MKKILLSAVFITVTFIATAQDIAEEIPQVVAECTTCIPALIEKNWPYGIACIVAAVAAGAVRYFKKKKLAKKK